MGRFSRFTAEEKYDLAWYIKADGQPFAEIKVSENYGVREAEDIIDLIVGALNLHGA